jgi:peroxiredoxin Q/BCP
MKVLISQIVSKNGLLVLLIIFLSWALIQNRSLKNQLNRKYEPPDILHAGDVIPFFSGVDINGHEIDESDLATKEIILFAVFRSTCPFCKKMVPFWNELYEAIDGKDIVMIGIATEDDSSATNFASSHELMFPILSLTNSAAGDSLEKYYKMNVVPLLIVVTGDGLVKEVTSGSLDEDRQTQIIMNLLTVRYSQIVGFARQIC